MKSCGGEALNRITNLGFVLLGPLDANDDP